MHVATNSASAVVWKRMADENQQAVRLLTRICAGLFALSLAAGTYAYTAHVRYDQLCTSIERQTGSGAAPAAPRTGDETAKAYCA